MRRRNIVVPRTRILHYAKSGREYTRDFCGGGEIRTLETLSGLPPFSDTK